MNISGIKLYHYPASRSARAKWALHETVGDDFEVEIVPLYEGAQYHPDYLRKNPNHNVPVLEMTLEDGSTHRMLESGAMIALLADAFPDKNLAPPATEFSERRADYLQILHFGSGWIDMMLWQIRIHEHVLPDDERDPATAERYRNKFVTEAEPQLAARLKQSAFICGDEFCAADIVIAHDVGWARMYDLCADRVFSRYMANVSKRPAFAKAFADREQFDPVLPDSAREARGFTG